MTNDEAFSLIQELEKCSGLKQYTNKPGELNILCKAYNRAKYNTCTYNRAKYNTCTFNRAKYNTCTYSQVKLI